MNQHSGTPLYDDDVISRAIFFPTWRRRQAVVKNACQVFIELGDGIKIGALWVRSHVAAPTLLFFHGNGENIADQLYTWPEWTAALGLNVLFVDYPGYSTSSGRPSLGLTRRACWEALRFLLRQPRRRVPAVLVLGRSLGSIFALDCASRCRSSRLAGLILESAMANVATWLDAKFDWPVANLDRHRLREELTRDVDLRGKIQRLRCPLLVLHCADDDMLSVDNARQLVSWAASDQAKLTIFETGGHNGIQYYNRHAYRQALADFCADVFGR